MTVCYIAMDVEPHWGAQGGRIFDGAAAPCSPLETAPAPK